MATAPKKLSSLEELKRLSAHFDRRRDRAKQRLKSGKKPGWHFGIIGLNCEVPVFHFAEEELVLEEVQDPPGEVELVRALVRPELFSAIARYSRNITHQLRVSETDLSKQQFCFDVAWWIISLIRVRSLSEFLTPIASDHSWSVIAGLDKKQCNVEFIEDVPRAKKLEPSKSIRQSDLMWVKDHFFKFVNLLETPSFRLSVECLTTHQHQTNERMMAAMLWSGIESLFAIQAELSFRISTYISYILESPGEHRRDLYLRVKKLYGVRSKAVHGSKLSKHELQEHVVEVRLLLSRLLCRMIELENIFSEKDIENFLFCVTENHKNYRG